MDRTRDFDLIIYGASGFTGRLVAEYVARTYGAGEGASLRWAMAGRNAEKLERVRAELVDGGVSAAAAAPVLAADAQDPDALRMLVDQTHVLLTTAGPYQLYGAPVVAACAAAGTDYVDLCGEVHWMRTMIDRHEAEAKASGARIVFSCGFDSAPFDLGVFFLQEQAKARLGHPVPRVKGRVRAMKGTFSGGTAASFRATVAAAQEDDAIRALLMSPFSLTPGFEGPPQPPGHKPVEDDAAGGWSAPFIMAPINTRNVHRSNFLMGHPYGTDFVYDEMIVAGPGDAGRQMADAIEAGVAKAVGEDAPAPGEGPSQAEREAGSYDIAFFGEDADGTRVRAGVTGDRDPGYGSTSKMIAECALCLLDEAKDLPGGIYTPAAAFGAAGIARLSQKAGLTFTLEEG